MNYRDRKNSHGEVTEVWSEIDCYAGMLLSIIDHIHGSENYLYKCRKMSNQVAYIYKIVNVMNTLTKINLPKLTMERVG